MSGGRNQRALLMEIMIAVLFFALCASVLLQTFVAAREYSRGAGAQGAALLEAQSLANRLSASEDMAATLFEQGFEECDGLYLRAEAELRFEVELGAEQTAAGTVQTAQVRALQEHKVLAELRAARYRPGEVAA